MNLSDSSKPRRKMSGEEIRRDEYLTILERVLKTLTYREREVIRLRYRIGGGKHFTQRAAGELFFITRQRICQIESKAIRKLQHPRRIQKLKRLLTPYADLTMPECLRSLVNRIKLGLGR